MILNYTLDNCRELYGMEAELNSTHISTEDGYSYTINHVSFFVNRSELPKLIVRFDEDEEKKIIEWIEAQLNDYSNHLLTEIRAEVDEDHGICHEPDGALSLHDLNR
jgi:hypothetical protein